MSDVTAYLLINWPHKDTVWHRFDLKHREVLLGRPSAKDNNQNEDLQSIELELGWISRDHVRIVDNGGIYVLQCRSDKGVRIYEAILSSGQTHTLRHGDMFRIPSMLDFEHVVLQFFLRDPSGDRTQVRPIAIDVSGGEVRVFGTAIKLIGNPRKLLLFLYANRNKECTYSEIVNELWPDDKGDIYLRVRQIQVTMNNLREQIRQHSGGFSFIETINQTGYRLIV